MKLVWRVQDVIDSVKKGAFVAYRLVYGEGCGPQEFEYYILETDEEVARFEELVQATEQKEGPEVVEAFKTLEDFLWVSCGGGLFFGRGGDFSVLYKDGEWLQSPEDLLKEEPDFQQMEEDYDQQTEEDWEHWSGAQSQFGAADKPSPVTGKEPWLRKVIDLAEEIAASQNRELEMADINTAIISLHDQVPPEITEILNQELKAIEEGRIRMTALPRILWRKYLYRGTSLFTESGYGY